MQEGRGGMVFVFGRMVVFFLFWVYLYILNLLLSTREKVSLSSCFDFNVKVVFNLFIIKVGREFYLLF